MNDTVNNEEIVVQETPPQTEITIPQSAEIVKEKVSKIAVVPQWRQILKTYSFYFYISSIILTLVDQILPLLTIIEPVMSGSTYVIVVFTLNILGVASRFVQQRNLWRYTVTEEPKE